MACGQKADQKKHNTQTQHSKHQNMDLSTITDSSVKHAIEALQAGDKNGTIILPKPNND
jgi:hypothetical protein